DSAHKHVEGAAEFVDDITEPEGTLNAYLGLSTCAHGEIVAMDLDPVRAAPGVVGVLTAADIPGVNDISPNHKHDEPIFPEREGRFYGQPISAVSATARQAERRAARLAKIEYAELPFIPDVAAARAAGGALVTEGMTLERGDVDAGFATASNVLDGTMVMGGQDHFYLESQIAMAIPGEDDE